MENNEDIIYYQNSYYDEVFGGRYNFPVPTSQTKDKRKKLEFKKQVKVLLKKINNPKWPYKQRLTVTIEIKGARKYITKIDIDNTIKLLLDILKKEVFVDDKQIYSIMASKIVMPDFEGSEMHGFLVGIRLLQGNEFNCCVPPLYSKNPVNKIENGVTKMWKAIEN